MVAALMARADRIREADDYLRARTGKYAWRCERYAAAWWAMHRTGGTDSADIALFDVGAGATEFGRYLYGQGYRGRYWPLDASIDGLDLDAWVPPRPADYFVALELLEHLSDPWRLVRCMQAAARRAIVVSTPNPETTDVLGMDATHRTVIAAGSLEALGFTVECRSFYGRADDSLFAVWRP